ncbi:MAG: restriction endonuclease [Phascolarctobacterium sp.]|nr:restriction endonuclease [Phascolarctobacterium sp.]
MNMSARFSSSGLLYVYLSGYEEEGNLFIQQIDLYRYIGDEFYYKIMGSVELADEDENMVHIFAVVGPKAKSDVVLSVFENEMKANFERILANKRIITNTQKLDSVGNIFFHCIQEFFCNQLNHFPKRVYHNYNDIVVAGVCCNHMSHKEGDSVINGVVSLWLEREQPELCGKQLITRSFFMRDFAARKVIASLPDSETGVWRLIFEGGHQLYLSEDAPYTKEPLHPNDLGMFCSSTLQSVLLNPIYAYGKWFQPNDICEEWHKVFLYLCAVSDTDWNQDGIRKTYEKFLKFLDENICLLTEATPVISKEQYCRVLLTHIANFRNFLRGDDEPVISKDVLQTLNSRYVYLPYLWSLVKPASSRSPFSSHDLQEMIDQALCETDTHSKGVLWEDVAAYVLNNVAGWKVTGRRIRTGAQEIDLSIANFSLDNKLWQLGAYVLVECKNWNSHVDIHQIRNIAHISTMKGNKTAILFASNGITADAQEEILRLTTSNLSIVCITACDLKQLRSSDDCRLLIMDRWEKLQNTPEVSTVI